MKIGTRDSSPLSSTLSSSSAHHSWMTGSGGRGSHHPAFMPSLESPSFRVSRPTIDSLELEYWTCKYEKDSYGPERYSNSDTEGSQSPEDVRATSYLQSFPSTSSSKCNCTSIRVPDVSYSGWLQKLGSRRKVWNARFFVLKQTSLAYFVSEETSKTTLKDSIIVMSVDVARDTPNVLRIEGLDGKVILLKTQNHEDMKTWLKQLEDAVQARKSLLQLHVHKSRQCQQRMILESGWMHVQGETLKSWRKRYFVLTNGVVSYYTDSRSQSLPRRRAGVKAVSAWDGKQNGLIIHLVDGKIIKAYVESALERNRWLSSLAIASSMSERR